MGFREARISAAKEIGVRRQRRERRDEKIALYKEELRKMYFGVVDGGDTYDHQKLIDKHPQDAGWILAAERELFKEIRGGNGK